MKKKFFLVAAYAFALALQRGLLLIVIPFFTRSLSPDDFSIYSTWSALYLFFQIILGLGIEPAVNRLFHDYNNHKYLQASYLNSTLLCQWIFNPILALFVIFLFYLVVSHIKVDLVLTPYLYFVVGSVTFAKIVQTILSGLRASGQSIRFLLIAFSQFLLSSSLLIIFFFTQGLSGYSVFESLLISNLIVAVAASLDQLLVMRKWTFRAKYYIISCKFGIFQLLGPIGNWLSSSASRLVVLFTLPLFAVGQLQIAVVPMSLLVMFSMSVNSAFRPWLYSNYLKVVNTGSSSDMSLFNKKVKSFDSLLIFIFFSMFSCFSLFSAEIVALIAPDNNYYASIQLMPLATFSGFLYFQCSLFNRGLTLKKLPFKHAMTFFIPGILSLPMYYIFADLFGLIAIPVVNILISFSAIALTLFFSRELSNNIKLLDFKTFLKINSLSSALLCLSLSNFLLESSSLYYRSVFLFIFTSIAFVISFRGFTFFNQFSLFFRHK